MFDKKKCKKCKYHMKISGGMRDLKLNRDNLQNIICAYSLITYTTCLYEENNEIKDRRGDDPKHCLLFKGGEK